MIAPQAWTSQPVGRSLCALLVAALPACNCHNTKLTQVCGVSVTPSTEDFGTVSLGQSVTLPLTILNSGTAPLTVLSAVASGDSSFQVGSLATSQITPGSSVEIQIAFNPTTAGPHTATLDITTDDACANPTSTVTLTGIGTSYGVLATPTSLSFGCAGPNGRSPAQTVTLTNASNPPEPETLTLTLDSTGEFELSPSATVIALPAGGSYTFSVLFAPTALGTISATWSIAACGIAGDGGVLGACPAISLPLTGTGSNTMLVATPAAVDFGLVPLGSLPSLRTVVVQAQALPAGSNCAIPVTLDLPSLEFGDAGFTLDAGTDLVWPMALAPPASFPLVVAFEPGDGGAFTDQAVLPYAVSGLTQQGLRIPLTAQVGVGPCNLTVTPASVSFGTVAMGQTMDASVVVTNPGTSLCEVTAAAITLNDADDEFGIGVGGNPLPFALAQGQSESVDVTFEVVSTAAPSLRDGRLTLSTNEIGGTDAGSFGISVPLSATVVATVPGLGCSDSTREGFTDVETFPSIAACSGAWSVAGLPAPVSCGLQSGNDSTNPDGNGCAAADLCASGWHLCTSYADVASHLPAGQDCNAITTTPMLFFASQQSGMGCGTCSGADGAACQVLTCNDPNPDSECVVDLFGCGTAGISPDPSCGPLTDGGGAKFTGRACANVSADWGANGTCTDFFEQKDITKATPGGGGVLCCSN